MFRTCLCELRRICGIRQTLPTSYALPDIRLGTGGQPIVRGYYGDVHAGFLNGSKVRVKRLFASNGAEQNSTKVCHSHYHFPLFADAGKSTEFLRGGYSVEMLGTPKHRPPPGYQYYSFPSTINLGLDFGWEFNGIHQRPSRGRPTWSRKCPSYIGWLMCLPLPQAI